ncbi:hypothetical protein LG293_17575 (plasmid) [Citricoccus nitrophenolicus]
MSTSPDRAQKWWLVDLPQPWTGADLVFHRLVTGEPALKDRPGSGQALVAFPAEATHVTIDLHGRYPYLGFGIRDDGSVLGLDPDQVGTVGAYVIEMEGLGITTLDEAVTMLARMGFAVTWTRAITVTGSWRVGVEATA